MNKSVYERDLGLTPAPSSSAERIVTEAVSILRKATVSAEGEVRHTGEQDSISEDTHVGHVIQVNIHAYSLGGDHGSRSTRRKEEIKFWITTAKNCHPVLVHFD